MRVSVVIPCFNEEDCLDRLEQRLGVAYGSTDEYEWETVLVDDGSTDRTPEMLQAIAARTPDTLVVTHSENRGLGAALRSGFQATTGELIVSIDSDCTYDPERIPQAVDALLAAEADILLGSPYHPEGATSNVRPWRLFLSQSLSRTYRVLVSRDIHTFTSVFRVHRREVVEDCAFRSDDYIALTEMLVCALRRGYKAIEFPTVLRVRTAGASKMKILRTCARHGGMIARIALGGGPK
jgi:dolichol-phosphate mannosyltransferase